MASFTQVLRRGDRAANPLVSRSKILYHCNAPARSRLCSSMASERLPA